MGGALAEVGKKDEAAIHIAAAQKTLDQVLRLTSTAFTNPTKQALAPAYAAVDIKLGEFTKAAEWARHFNASHVPVLSPDSSLLAVFAWQDLRERKPNVLEWLRLAKPSDRWSTLKLHDVRDGREIAAFTKGNAACFAPDGETLLVLNDDQTLHVWDIPPRPPWWRIGGVGALAGGVVLLGGRLRRRRGGK